MYVLKCVKPGKVWGVSVKEGRLLADARLDQDFTINPDKSMIFLSLEDAKFHMKNFLRDPENTALFCPCRIEIKVAMVGQ